MSKAIIQKLLLLAVLSLVAGGALKIYLSEPSEEVQLAADPNRPLQISGLRYSDYDNDYLVSRLQFDNLQVRPRRFGPFKIQSVNEVLIRNAQIERLPAPQKEQSINGERGSVSEQLSGNLRRFLKSQKIGRVQRVVFDGFQYTRTDSHPEEIASKIMARGAEYDFRQKKLTLIDATLEERTSMRHLSAGRVEWHESKQAWWISGAGELTKANQPRKTLNNVWLDEHLEQIPVKSL